MDGCWVEIDRPFPNGILYRCLSSLHPGFSGNLHVKNAVSNLFGQVKQTLRHSTQL